MISATFSLTEAWHVWILLCVTSNIFQRNQTTFEKNWLWYSYWLSIDAVNMKLRAWLHPGPKTFDSIQHRHRAHGKGQVLRHTIAAKRARQCDKTPAYPHAMLIHEPLQFFQTKYCVHFSVLETTRACFRPKRIDAFGLQFLLWNPVLSSFWRTGTHRPAAAWPKWLMTLKGTVPAVGDQSGCKYIHHKYT